MFNHRDSFFTCLTPGNDLYIPPNLRVETGTVFQLGKQLFNCIGNKNKPPAMQVCSQTALASSKKPPCYNEYKVRQPNHYNKEESKWTIIVYHTQNGHANII